MYVCIVQWCSSFGLCRPKHALDPGLPGVMPLWLFHPRYHREIWTSYLHVLWLNPRERLTICMYVQLHLSWGFFLSLVSLTFVALVARVPLVCRSLYIIRIITLDSLRPSVFFARLLHLVVAPPCQWLGIVQCFRRRCFSVTLCGSSPCQGKKIQIQKLFFFVKKKYFEKIYPNIFGKFRFFQHFEIL